MAMSKEEQQAYNRAYHAKNREKILAQQRLYRQEYREKIIEQDRKYREANREKINASRRNNHEKYAARKREWIEENRESINEKVRERRTTNGYWIWAEMIQRCTNPNNQSFNRYGGRPDNPVTVCDRWRYGEAGKSGYECWRLDIGPRPSKDLSMDRTDNDKGYYPDNVKWTLPLEQSGNRRDNVVIEHNGKRQTASAWARETGLPVDVIYYRTRKGWPLEHILELAA